MNLRNPFTRGLAPLAPGGRALDRGCEGLRAGARDAQPPAPGGVPPHWGSRHECWQLSIDARCTDGRPDKEPLPREVLAAIARHRLRTLCGPGVMLERDPAGCPRAGMLQLHARDAQGRNWNLVAAAGGGLPPASGEDALRGVIDALRDQFDLA